MPYTAIIVEDEAPQRETLIKLLGEVAHDIQVIGVATSFEDASALLRKTPADVAFMDVELRTGTSLDLLHQLPDIPFEVIFTTSFQEYAVKAFRLSAIDYLMKPISREELLSALVKFRQRRSAKESSTHIRTLLENMSTATAGHSKIALPTLTGYIFLKIKDIIRCESDNTYTVFFTTDKKNIIVSKTLKEYEQILVDYGFYRVHNSHLINLQHITAYTRGEGGTVHMADGSHVDVSRRKKESFLQRLNKL